MDEPTEAAVDPAPDFSQVPTTIEVWCCPRCGSWYGSQNSSELQEQQLRRTSLRNLANEDPSEWGKVTGTRAQCGFCRSQAGVLVERVKIPFLRVDAVQQALAEGVEAAYQEEEKQGRVKLGRPAV